MAKKTSLMETAYPYIRLDWQAQAVRWELPRFHFILTKPLSEGGHSTHFIYPVLYFVNLYSTSYSALRDLKKDAKTTSRSRLRSLRSERSYVLYSAI